MPRWVALTAALTLSSVIGWGAYARAADTKGAKGLETSTVEFKGGHGQVKGYLAKPNGPGPFPAVIVIHEWWGLSDWVKENTRHLAAEGYVALAVDLYNGKLTADPGEAHELMRALDQSEGLADLKGGLSYLQARSFVDKGRKVGAIGWCMGGAFSRTLAQSSELVGPTVICYGSVATDSEQIAKLANKPILGIFGATDRGIPAAKVKEFEAALTKAGDKNVEVRIYDGAGHGFMRPGGPQFNAEAAKDAWKQIDGFFVQYLLP